MFQDIIFVAWTVQIGVLTACVFASDYGIGRHMWDVRLRDFIQTQYVRSSISFHSSRTFADMK